jgi:hypothetical protein
MNSYEVNMKTCTKCNETKDLHDFRKWRNSKGEMVAKSSCKTCENAYLKSWKRKNVSKTGLSHKDYRNSLRLPAKLSEQKDLLAKDVKTCKHCNESLPLSNFYIKNHKRTDGSTVELLYSYCKECESLRHKAYTKTHEGKTSLKRSNALRSKRTRNATPNWLTPEQRKEIADIYEHMRDCRAVTGEEYHVDHIVPLKGKNVCGLHVPWNLQVLPSDVNMSKSNRL